MSLEELQPANTLGAKATAIKVYIKECIECDESGKCFVAVMDKFGMYLAFSSGAKSKQLARNTVIQYNRQATLWMLD
ncbi:hypothetical protein PHMEG_00012524 [Phytophthora megakarya]|uniref:Uncharacterized protein n=1 Tax=Phytophthora megakarya TaxID=4795 RepID=A0A225W8I8_9STRA|nr:hypothetical protein PHMEG_00012524 [Phytophthora megakarya]